MKKLLIFDFDGTLIDSLDDAIDVINDILNDLNLPKLDFKETTFEETILKLENQYDVSKEDMEKYLKIFKDKYKIHPKDKTLPFDGIIELLENLNKENILLAINSKKDESQIKYFINKYFKNIDFFAITGNNSINPRKPNPTCVLRIIKNANLKKEDCIYIGDSISDIQTAKNAGIELILVSWGQSDRKVRENKYITYIANNPSEILEFIKS